jgi:hypothetical protein
MALDYIASGSIIYLMSAVMSFLVTIYTLITYFKSNIHKIFFIYGLFSTLYLLLLFVKFNAPDKETATQLFTYSNMAYILSIAALAYLMKVLSENKIKELYLLVPPVIALIAAPYVKYESYLTEYGWSTKALPEITISGVIIFLYLVAYSFLILHSTYCIIRSKKAPWIVKKYMVMSISFVGLQVLFVMTINTLVAISDSMPPISGIGGIAYFISLVLLFYSLNLKVSKEIAYLQDTDITKSYKKFIERFLQTAPSDELGLKTFDFLEYLEKTRLSNIVTYDNLRIILNVNKMENVDNIQAISKTIEYLMEKDWGHKLAQSFLNILEVVFQNINAKTDIDKSAAFNDVVIKHQDFLKRTDIIYGLAKGQLLELIQQDHSLCDLQEWNAVVRFYIRLLLPLRKFITGPIKADFLMMIRSADVIKFLEVSDDGEIEAEAVIKYVNSIPEKRRVEAVREGFNMLIVWTMQRLAESDPSAYADYLRTIRRVTKLNAEAKGIWRAYFSLVDRATKELGRARIRDLVLSEGYSYADLEAFSSPLGLSHDALVRNIVTLEYDPRYPYEHYVSSAMREVLANTERCVLFTRLGSRVLEVAKDLGDVELKVMTTIGTIEEGIPFNDTSKLLDIVGRELESELATWIVFDNISDLVLAVGFDEAYVFARRVIDLVSSKGASLLLLMNKGAHSTEVMRTFEGLSTRIVEAAERLRLIR